MQTDDLAGFRLAHPSLANALAKVERPDWALRLAYESTAPGSDDRKDVIRIGANAARFLHASNRAAVIAFFTPRPGPLEAIEVWTGDTDKYTEPMRNARAGAIAAPFAALVTWAVDHFVVAPRFAAGLRIAAVNVSFVVFAFLLGRLVKVWLAAAVRRQVRALDDPSARDIVLRHMTSGVAKKPERVALAMTTMRRQLRKVVAEKPDELHRGRR